MANFMPAGFEEDLSDEDGYVFGDGSASSKTKLVNGTSSVNGSSIATHSQPVPMYDNNANGSFNGNGNDNVIRGGFGKPPNRPKTLPHGGGHFSDSNKQSPTPDYSTQNSGQLRSTERRNKVAKPVFSKSKPILIQQSNSTTGASSIKDDAAGGGEPGLPGAQKKSNQKKKVEPQDLGILPVEDYRIAAMRGNVDALRNYIEQGVPVDAVFSSGWTALMYAACAIQTDCVKLLLEKGADPNFNKDLYTVLMTACACSRGTDSAVEQTVLLLLDHKAEINAFDRHHMSPLLYAAREGRVSAVKCLADRGANLDKQDTNGYTALIYAAIRGHILVVRALVEAGADQTRKSCDGSRAVDWAAINGFTQIESLLKDPKAVAMNGVPVGQTAADDTLAESQQNTQRDSQTSAPKPSIVQYGDLELFLSGLDLSHLVTVFYEHQIAFKDVLRLTDTDLQQLGVSQLGARKKILDSIRDIHKKDWETNSIIAPQYNKQIRCNEAVAMVTNVKKHASYIASTVGYISDQIKADRKILVNAQTGAGAEELVIQTEETLTNVRFLYEELTSLRRHLGQVQGKREFSPPDLIDPRLDAPSSPGSSPAVRLLLLAGCGGLIYWKWDQVAVRISDLWEMLIPKG